MSALISLVFLKSSIAVVALTDDAGRSSATRHRTPCLLAATPGLHACRMMPFCAMLGAIAENRKLRPGIFVLVVDYY